MNRILKEADFKVITIEWLVTKGLLNDDAVLINELPVDNFSRRADLVVANGKLHAFEIKSDADSLARLSGQIKTYLSFFDKVTVICSKKYTSKALALLPKAVEILELHINNDCSSSLKVVRRGKIKEITDYYNFLSFVEKKELINVLKQQGFSCHSGESRISLCKKLGTLPKCFWRNVALNYLKKKYKATHESFFENRNRKLIVSDLSHLSLQKMNCEKSSTLYEHERNDFNIERCQDYDAKLKKYGVDISDNIYKLGFIANSPIRVIPRMVK